MKKAIVFIFIGLCSMVQLSSLPKVEYTAVERLNNSLDKLSNEIYRNRNNVNMPNRVQHIQKNKQDFR